MAQASVIYIAIPSHLQREALQFLAAVQENKVVGYPVPDPQRPGKRKWRSVPVQTVYRPVTK
jgi:hypothetical protein